MDRIVTLGVKGGPSMRAGCSMPSSSLLELDGQVIVVDAGLGVTRGLVNAGVDLNRLGVIFVTHLHSDHVLELGGLIHTAWVSGRKDRIRVFGPKGLGAYWAGFQAAMAMDIHLRVVDDGRMPLAELVEVNEIAAGDVALDGLVVRAYATRHPPVEHSFAYRFEGAKVVVFSGDTVFDPGLGEFARGADVLVHEALLPEGIEAILARTGGGEKLRAHLTGSHTMIDDVGRVAGLAGAGRLVLNHQVPVDDPAFTEKMWQERAAAQYRGPVILARDGMEIAL